MKYLVLIYSAKMSSMAHSSLPQKKKKKVYSYSFLQDTIQSFCMF